MKKIYLGVCMIVGNMVAITEMQKEILSKLKYQSSFGGLSINGLSEQLFEVYNKFIDQKTKEALESKRKNLSPTEALHSYDYQGGPGSERYWLDLDFVYLEYIRRNQDNFIMQAKNFIENLNMNDFELEYAFWDPTIFTSYILIKKKESEYDNIVKNIILASNRNPLSSQFDSKKELLLKTIIELAKQKQQEQQTQQTKVEPTIQQPSVQSEAEKKLAYWKKKADEFIENLSKKNFYKSILYKPTDIKSYSLNKDSMDEKTDIIWGIIADNDFYNNFLQKCKEKETQLIGAMVNEERVKAQQAQ